MSLQLIWNHHHKSQMAREHLALKFGKRPKIIIKVKTQRFGQNNSGRLEVDTMQVCVLQFRQAATSRRKTIVEEQNDPILCTFSNSRH